MIALLVIGYSGFYLCRSHFSVAKPLLLETVPGLDKAALGLIASVGTLLYALGKFIHGPLADKWGGKPLFLYGLFGAIAFTLLFGLGGPPLFMLAWSANRFVQSAGWGGMVRIVSQWSTPQKYGLAMAVVSLSYLFGDFLSRLLLGYWVGLGATWSQLFVWSAMGLGLIAIPVVWLLRERPEGAEMVPATAPIQSGAASGGGSIFARPDFWMVCFLSFCFTLLRETFNEWTPTYLNEAAGLAKAAAGQASSIFPLFGGLSVLAVGAFSDRIARETNPMRRLAVVPYGLGLTAVLLGILGQVPGLNPAVTVALVGLIGFCLIGPYSLLAGATSLDFGGSQKAASAAGLIDGVGYIGGILSGYAVGSLAQNLGWAMSLSGLGVMCAVVALGTGLLLKYQARKFG